MTEVVTYVSKKAAHPDTPLPKVAQGPQDGAQQSQKGLGGQVIVIGAGPAGLAAASHLQVQKGNACTSIGRGCGADTATG